MSSFQESQVDHPWAQLPHWCGVLSVEPDPGRGGLRVSESLAHVHLRLPEDGVFANSSTWTGAFV